MFVFVVVWLVFICLPTIGDDPACWSIFHSGEGYCGDSSIISGAATESACQDKCESMYKRYCTWIEGAINLRCLWANQCSINTLMVNVVIYVDNCFTSPSPTNKPSLLPTCMLQQSIQGRNPNYRTSGLVSLSLSGLWLRSAHHALRSATHSLQFYIIFCSIFFIDSNLILYR